MTLALVNSASSTTKQSRKVNDRFELHIGVIISSEEIATYFDLVSNNYNQTPNHSHHFMDYDGGSIAVVHGGVMAVHGYFKQLQYP